MEKGGSGVPTVVPRRQQRKNNTKPMRNPEERETPQELQEKAKAEGSEGGSLTVPAAGTEGRGVVPHGHGGMFQGNGRARRAERSAVGPGTGAGRSCSGRLSGRSHADPFTQHAAACGSALGVPDLAERL